MPAKVMRDSFGNDVYVYPPCIFCGGVEVIGITTRGITTRSKVLPSECPANGNGPHIRDDEYPPDVIAEIKRSRGIP